MIKKSHLCIIDNRVDIYKCLIEQNVFDISFCNCANEFELLLDKNLLEIELIIIDGHNCWNLLTKIRLNPLLKRLPIILTSKSENEAILVSGLKLGADDYICKPFNLITLTAKIEALLRRISWTEEDNRSYCTTENPIKKNNLTVREQEILQLIAKGKNNRQVAEDLYLSELTVKTHLKNIFKKMQVANRTQAILMAMGKGLIENKYP